MKTPALAAAAAALALVLPSGPRGAPPLAPAPGERRAAAEITAPLLRAHLRFLSSDLLEGRAPGTRGDALTQAYVISQLEALGLEPGAPDGSWLQRVPLVGVETSVARPPRFEGGGRSLALRAGEFVANAGVQAPEVEVDGREVVFVGYGIVAPEHGWDDYAGADVRGKVVLVMNDDPSHDPALFGGPRRLYYGRWTYKYEEAARHGAAGAIVIHTTPSAAYPWQVVQTSWAGPQFELPEKGGPRVPARLWATEDASRRIAALGGHDLDRLREAALRRGFRAVPLGVRMSVGLRTRITRVESANVVGKLPGRPGRRAGEAVIFMAHHDHLGVKPGAAPGEDAIYNGAVDNATGVAALLAMARAAAALPQRPARSLYFAAVGAEEQGTLGSRLLAREPPVPAGRIAAALNVDALNVFGRTRDVTVIGLGKSSLDAVVAGVAAWQGREVRGDPFPDKGSYYRSDHFPLAQAGVPAAYVDGGTEYRGRPPGWGVELAEEWQRKHYHQPSDELDEGWDLSGLVEDAQLVFLVGAKVAEAKEMPRWRSGDEFEAARERSLSELGSSR